jgi:4-amino-4-deoxy-L-arabinose transferase-like glycosyltransferase
MRSAHSLQPATSPTGSTPPGPFVFFPGPRAAAEYAARGFFLQTLPVVLCDGRNGNRFLFFGGLDMNTTVTSKPWYASTGVWGALVTVAGSVLALLKFELDPELLDDLREWVLALATLVGGAVALWGRIRATRRIGQKPLAVGLVAILLVSSGCNVLTEPAGPYVAADRATYDAIAPEYRQYVAGDSALDADERTRRERTVELWRLRLEDAETRSTKSEIRNKHEIQNEEMTQTRAPMRDPDPF